MKKLLLGSTALLGAIALSGAASAQNVTTRAPFTLTIGGSFSSYFGVNSGGDENLSTNKKNYDLLHESLLQFSASAKTDNGLTYGALVRQYLSGAGASNNSNSGNQNLANQNFDRSLVFLQGSFGRIVVGNAPNPAGDSATGVNAVGPAWGNTLGPDGGMALYFYNFQNAAGGAARLASTSNGAGAMFAGRAAVSRRPKVGYTTPDFSGFQASIMYAPSPGNNGTTFDRTDTVPAGNLLDGPSARFLFRDAVQVFARYQTTIADVKVTPMVSYLTASALKAAPSGATAGLKTEPNNAVYAGILAEYMGASLGFGYSNSFKSGLVKNNAANVAPGQSDAQGFVVAAGYVTGPYALSGYYQWAEQEGNQSATTRGKDSLRIFEIAAGYTLAPGLQLWTAVNNYEFKDESVNKYNGTLFLLGTTLSF